MLNRLVELSLRYKFLVLIIFAVVAFLGLSAVRSVPIDAFPDVTPAQVNIYTESPGLAAEDDVVSAGHRARNAGVCGHQIVAADDAVVADHHQIIDLGVLADDGVVIGAAIDAGVGADGHPILQDDAAQLGNIHRTGLGPGGAEARLTDARACQ